MATIAITFFFATPPYKKTMATIVGTFFFSATEP